MEKLTRIQSKIKVQKTLWNKFGNYYYRSAETILSALKPLLIKENAALILSDEMVQVGDRFYVKGTAKLIDNETKEEVLVNAYAREPHSKKGMDESQITGSASSYARKYALNGLLLLEDSKDSDDLNSNESEELEKHKGERNYKNMRILQIVDGTPIKVGQVKAWIDKEFGSYIEFNDLTDEQFLQVTTALYKKLDTLMDG